MKNKLYSLGLIILSLFLGYLYNQVTFSSSSETFREYRKVVTLTTNEARLSISLFKEAHLLKIKHVFQNNQEKEFYVNGNRFYPSILNNVKLRGIIETNWIYIPKREINSGENAISVVFKGNHPSDVDFTLSNYRRKLGDDFFVLFNDSLPTKPKISIKALIVPLILILFFGLLLHLGNLIFGVSLNRLFLFQLYSILPFLVFLISITISYYIYRVFISPAYFWKLGLISFLLAQSCIAIPKLMRSLKSGYQGVSRETNGRTGQALGRYYLRIADNFHKYLYQVINWISSLGLADKAIILFLVSMILGMLFLFLHINVIAEFIAYIGYFSILIGLSVKFVKFVKGGDKE